MNIIILDDCGDTSDIEDWVEGEDGLNPVLGLGKQGSHSMALGIDADLGGGDYASWYNSHSFGDLSAYQHDWLYFWIYSSTLDHLLTPGTALHFGVGNDISNFIEFNWAKSELSVGWNLLKCDLDNPSDTTGTVNWTAIDWMRILVMETVDNTTDFTVYVDSIMIVRNPTSTGMSYDLGTSAFTTVTLYPEWDYSKGERQVRTEHRSKSGKLKLYKWYDYEKIYFQNNWVQASDAALVNSWWDTNTKLLFFVSSDFVTEVHSVMIMNDETPLASYNKPYNDHFKGKIELEGY